MHQESTRYVRLILFCHSSCLLAYFDNSCNIGGTTVLPAWPSLFQPKKIFCETENNKIVQDNHDFFSQVSNNSML